MPDDEALPPQPSDAYLTRIGINPRDADHLDPITLARHAWREQADLWLTTHSDPVKATADAISAWADACRSEGRHDDPAGVRWWWEEHGLIAYGLGDDWLWLPRETPPNYVLAVILAQPPPGPAGEQRPVAPARDTLGPAADLPGYVAVRGILAAVQSHTTDWQASDQGTPIYHWVKEETAVSTSIMPPQGPQGVVLTPEGHTALWSMTRALDDADGDVLLAALAQGLGSGGRQPDGTVWLSADALLDYRGIIPKTRHAPQGTGYLRAGHRAEDRAEIAASMDRLDHLYVTIEERRSRHRVYAHESKVLAVLARAVARSLDGDESIVLAWRYRIGDWLDTERLRDAPAFAALLRQVVSYDPQRQLWEKRLARFIMLSGTMDAHDHRCMLTSVGTLLDDTQLSDKCNAQRPGQSRKRFEKALDQLRHDGVIVDLTDSQGRIVTPAWQYTPTGQQVVAALPRYDWLPQWRGAEIQLVLPQLAPGQSFAIPTPRGRGRPRKSTSPPQPLPLQP